MSIPPDDLRLLRVDGLQLPQVMPSQLDPQVRSYLQDLHANLTFYTDQVNQALNILLEVVNGMTKP